ncbi:jg5405 [Pararge aegeria aegeria]|uniref:Jg5405 protein n=1 Tax=Pararge aegeria aegeria TaxID=348720 RepID=A0A8S4S7G6_9NEOP|nr:jg5405 [Pararge aegeria aegeria]
MLSKSVGGRAGGSSTELLPALCFIPLVASYDNRGKRSGGDKCFLYSVTTRQILRVHRTYCKFIENEQKNDILIIFVWNIRNIEYLSFQVLQKLDYELELKHHLRTPNRFLLKILLFNDYYCHKLITDTFRRDERTVYGHIGRTLYSAYTSEDVEGGVNIFIGTANLTVRTVRDDAVDARGIKIKWDSYEPIRFEDCLDFGSKHWYAGPMQIDQIYPIEGAHQNYSAYVSKELDNGAIVERYWLNSAGEYIYVNPQVPLFVDYNLIHPNHICLGAQLAAPYSTRRNYTELSYDFWFLPNVKKAHKHAIAHYLGKPSGLPDFRMVQHPIWSTWAQYSQNITGEKVIEYANQIIAHGFNNSQLEIDDLWETCYGSLEVDTNKFPNLTHLVEEVKALGFRVTIWVHPFINSNCDPVYTDALNNGYLVLDEAGTAAANWWNPNGSIPGLVDFTKPAAAEWWYNRVKNLIDTYGIDSIKFDAGESSFSPQIAVQEGDIDLHPHNIVDAYVRTCARFGDMIEVRAGFRTQDLPIFVRMVDRDSIWGLNNGLPTIVTTTIQMNLNGYSLVLPDMIGGNGYNLNHAQADLPSKELFIRWAQANTFLPAMQYSFAPWNFDNEWDSVCRLSKMFGTLVLAALVAGSLAVDVALVSEEELGVRVQDHTSGGLNIIVTRNNSASTLMWIGRYAGVATGSVVDEDLLVYFSNNVSVRISSSQIQVPKRGTVISVAWRAPTNALLIDCLNLELYSGLSNHRKDILKINLLSQPVCAGAPCYLVLSEEGSEVTSWWNDNGTTAAYVDYTKPEARKWYNDRVQLLRDQYGIDSFKFDGGETSWSPQIPVLQSDIDGQPSAITTEYVKSVAQFGPMVEVRSGYGTQDLPIFVRMIDKDSYFTFENGLPTLITTLLQMNLNGYTLVLPDMIGGNGYNNTTPSKELFIRWLQANVFMPSMQFSYVPWDYDDETVQISRELVALHEQYAPDIIRACQRSVADGSPVNAPIWWIAPEDTTAHAIWDEFLLGEDILAAPVVTQGATSRDIYLPAGRWKELGNSSLIHEGPIWIRNYAAPLNVLPYFIRDLSSPNSASTPCVAALLVVLGLVINILIKN